MKKQAKDEQRELGKPGQNMTETKNVKARKNDMEKTSQNSKSKSNDKTSHVTV